MRSPPRTPPSGERLQKILSQVQDRTRAIRREVVFNDLQRQHYGRWTRIGVIGTVIGAGLMLGAMAAAPGSMALAVSLTGAGAVGLGAGASVAIINARRLDKESERTADIAQEAMNLSDSLIHKLKQDGTSPAAAKEPSMPA